MLAAELQAALREAQVPVEGVSIGTPHDRTTWRVSPSQLQAQAQPIIDAFDLRRAAVAALRQQRNLKLSASDWTQLADAPPAAQAAWKAYRQALRDLPATVADPANPVWPTPPSA